jgi:hypothetical protein
VDEAWLARRDAAGRRGTCRFGATYSSSSSESKAIRGRSMGGPDGTWDGESLLKGRVSVISFISVGVEDGEDTSPPAASPGGGTGCRCFGVEVTKASGKLGGIIWRSTCRK